MRLEYHPAAIEDLNSAIRHYDGKRTGLGDGLRAEVYIAIDSILESPLRCKESERGIRRRLVRRFPYSILFRMPAVDTVRVLVIRHHRRNPGYGIKRR